MEEGALSSTGNTLSQVDWLSELDALAYAYGKPIVFGHVKQAPEHFIVTEVMDVEPSGQGEHYWLDITKTRLNTDAVAKTLARFSGVANRDIGYSGMKDFHAVTRQWFSVWRPKGAELDWSSYGHDGVVVHSVVKHDRKIKRGTHKANHFRIRVVGVSGIDAAHRLLNSRLEQIRESGVPNYFGTQRFGRGANNLTQALGMFSGRRRVKDRNLRGILLSSARSWLFNQVISARIKAKTWQSLYIGEPANLNGSNSVFIVSDLNAENTRLQNLDIHPTAPLWGEQKERENAASNSEGGSELALLEEAAMSPYLILKKGLEDARVEYQRRAIRLVPTKLEWSFKENDLFLSFELQRGQFATSVLRELVSEKI
jgi:tRNA pseudouridine13 synthase